MADTLCHLSFNISETDHATKKIAADIAITLKVLMDKQKILPYPFKLFEKSNASKILNSLSKVRNYIDEAASVC